MSIGKIVKASVLLFIALTLGVVAIGALSAVMN
jgi:hypothetical protein